MHKLKNMLMKKLDDFAAYYENKELKDINPTAVDFMVKATETLENISTIEAMDEYGEQYMDEMSGYPRRSPRTGRFVSRDGGRSGRMYPMYAYNDGYSRDGHESYNDGYSHGGSYNDGYSHDNKKSALRAQLEETMRTSRNEEEREAARKMLKAMEGSN